MELLMSDISLLTCITDISNLRRVRNMKTSRILPASCNRKFIHLPSLGCSESSERNALV